MPRRCWDDEAPEEDEDLDPDEAELTPEQEAELEEALRAERRRYINVSRTLSAGLIAVLPLLALYEAGVLLYRAEFNAAAEWVKHPIFWLQRLLMSELGVDFVLVLNGVAILAVFIAMWRLRRRGGLRAGVFLGILVESAVYAMALGPLILFVLTHTIRFSGFAPHFDSFFRKLVISFGAGLYEEFIFRLLILGGIFRLGRNVAGLRPFVAGLLALLVSSAAFSAAHFLGGGESADLGLFVYRLLAGVVLGVIFLVRGFGIAAWTHALYDLYVLCFVPA